MAYRDGNYFAFYVAESFHESSLKAHVTKEIFYYNVLRKWKGKYSSFQFIDSHDKDYNVRDGSGWEKMLKPRLHLHLQNSKNIVLCHSYETKESQMLAEEVGCGINNRDSRVIIVYPENTFNKSFFSDVDLKRSVKFFWDKLPIFIDPMLKIPTLRIALNNINYRGFYDGNFKN